MQIAGYPSEVPLFRADGGIVFSSGRTGSGEGEMTGPIARDVHFERVLRTGEGDFAFGLTDIVQTYLAGRRGKVAALRIGDDTGPVIEPLGRGRFLRIWDASAAPALRVLAEAEAGGELAIFARDGGGDWSEQRIPTQGQLKLAYLERDGVVVISDSPSGCTRHVFDAAGRRSSAAVGAPPALCDAHAVWVLRDPFGEEPYIYAAEHQASRLFASDGHAGLTHVADGIEAAPAGLHPTRLLLSAGVLYFDAGTDSAGTPLVGTFVIATGVRRISPLPRSVSDPVRPTLMGFIAPRRESEPVEAVFRGGVWNTQPIIFQEGD